MKKDLPPANQWEEFPSTQTQSQEQELDLELELELELFYFQISEERKLPRHSQEYTQCWKQLTAHIYVWNVFKQRIIRSLCLEFGLI